METPKVAWGSATGGEWSRPASPPGRRNFSHFTGLQPTGGGAVLIWQEESTDFPISNLFTSKCPGPGGSWSTPSLLPVTSPGIDRRNPVAVSSGRRLYLLWSEDQMPMRPLVVGESSDDARSFRQCGASLFFYSKDPNASLCASGDRVWSAFYASVQSRLAYFRSNDAGRSWSKPFTLDKPPDVFTVQSALVAAPEGNAWFLWTDATGTVKLARLP